MRSILEIGDAGSPVKLGMTEGAEDDGVVAEDEGVVAEDDGVVAEDDVDSGLKLDFVFSGAAEDAVGVDELENKEWDENEHSFVTWNVD